MFTLPGLTEAVLCMGLALGSVEVDLRGVAGTIQLGCVWGEKKSVCECVCVREREGAREREREREGGSDGEREREGILIIRTLLCIQSTALSSSLISSLLTDTSVMACSSCLCTSSNLLSLST